MGAGASAEATEKLRVASDVDVKALVAELPEEARNKLVLALESGQAAKAEWKDCFVVFGQYACKDIPRMTKAALKDAPLQVAEETQAPRFTVLGLATNEAAPADAKDNVFWLAEFECMDAWAGPEHKERETNKTFVQDMMASGASADDGMPGMVTDMAGSFTGPAVHIERPEPPSGTQDNYACLVKAKAKDEECVGKIVDLLKLHGSEQLEVEENALDLTVMCPKHMVGPLPKDDLMVHWFGRWKTKDDFEKHKKAPHLHEFLSKLKDLIAGFDTMSMYDFADAKHFQK